MKRASFLFCFILFASIAHFSWCDNKIVPHPNLPDSTPWDLKALSNAPSYQWIDQSSKIRSLIFKGLPYKGHKQTSVFAYYSTPGILNGNPDSDKNLPAVVLVHGGGGRAFPEWVKLWSNNGYAAIAMDLAGCGADAKRLEDGGPDQSDQTKFSNIDEPVTEQWTYHAVANVVLAHSLILSFPEINAERTAITGISWGGYLTCITAGLDSRFKAAVPVYGCGYLNENSVWLNWFENKFTRVQSEKWTTLWDPSMYIRFAAMPMLFVNGGTDFAYPPDSYNKTYQLVKSPKNLYFVPKLDHGHIFDRPKEIMIFIDSILKNTLPLPRIKAIEVLDKKITSTVESKRKLVSAALHYTTDPIRVDNQKRNWMTIPAQITNGIIQVDEPAYSTIWFLTLTDDRGATVSSELQFPQEKTP